MSFNSKNVMIGSMKLSISENEACKICAVIYGTESIVKYDPVGRSNFRWQCEGNNRDHLVHRFTYGEPTMKLYRKRKIIKDHSDCPVCGYPSGIVGTPKKGAFCHICDCRFLLKGSAVILTDLGKFAEIPEWFTGEIDIKS